MKDQYSYYYVIYRINGHRRSQMFYHESDLKQWFYDASPLPPCVTELNFYHANDPLETPMEWIPKWAH